MDGYVYLMWCPSIKAVVGEPRVSHPVTWKFGMYKLGHTDDLRRRIAQLRSELKDPKIECRASYYTPCSREILEGLLLRHFNHFRARWDLKNELFNLPEKEAEGFEAVAKVIERPLFAAELFRLNAILKKVKAECQKAARSECKRGRSGRWRHPAGLNTVPST